MDTKEAGSKGGKASAKALTKKQREDRARNAGKAGGRGRPKITGSNAGV